jgi:hypothetical protein
MYVMVVSQRITFWCLVDLPHTKCVWLALCKVPRVNFIATTASFTIVHNAVTSPFWEVKSCSCNLAVEDLAWLHLGRLCVKSFGPKDIFMGNCEQQLPSFHGSLFMGQLAK